jgi:hypothetical protein
MICKKEDHSGDEAAEEDHRAVCKRYQDAGARRLIQDQRS